MLVRYLGFLFLMFMFLTSVKSQNNQIQQWPDGQKIAISLSYDDALDSQLDNVIPALEKYGFKASFYVVSSSKSMGERLNEWKQVAAKGHELGNHSIYHPCRGSLPGREWVAPHHDLDKYSIEQMLEELNTANTFLKALDGKDKRTLTLPCGDVEIEGQNYLEKIEDSFLAIKGQGVASGFSTLWVPEGVTGDELIEYVKSVPEGTSLINIIFHGVGGDYLIVSKEAHHELLQFLAANKKDFYVDTYINIMEYAKSK